MLGLSGLPEEEGVQDLILGIFLLWATEKPYRQNEQQQGKEQAEPERNPNAFQFQATVFLLGP